MTNPLNSESTPTPWAADLWTFLQHIDGNATLFATIQAALEGNASDLIELHAVVLQLGISVGDTDYDGLDDIEEAIHNTDPKCSDTDCDNHV